MKKLHSHKNPILLGVGISTVLIITLILSTACDIGLGQIVNTEKPVINSAGDAPPGTFLQGDKNKIELDISNKLGFKIVEVWMDVDYKDAKTGEPAAKKVYAQKDPDTGEWYVILDTTGMADGKIIGKVTAIDETGNTATTTEMVYNVKNTPPQIKLNMPLVDGENWDDDDFLANLHLTDPLTLGFDLMGLATDDYGIEKGYPMIMIWPAPGQDFSIQLGDDGMPLPGDDRYGTWRSLVVPSVRDGLTATKFTWSMMYLIPDSAAPGGWRLPGKDEPNNFLDQGKYRIRIKTRDLFGNENEYPNRTDTTRKPDKPSPKFIEINYKASNVPLIQFTEYPQYYNAVQDLEIYFRVSSQSQVTSVTASIVTSNDIEESTALGAYTPESKGTTGALYNFKLTVPAADAKLWIDNPKFPESGILFVKVQAAADTTVGPITYQNFIYDSVPPGVIIDRPVNLTNKAASGKLNGGSYEILYPDPERPKWVTGSITIGGSVDDNLTLIKKVYYHIGKLDDDNPSSDRESIYNSAVWEDTKLELPDKDKAKNWKGGLYSWTYTFDPFDNDYKTSAEGIERTQKHTDLFYNFPGSTYSETASPGRKRFYLPFYVKVVDSANNYKIIHYKLSVDPLLDEPSVTITQPEVKKDITTGAAITPIVGGTVRIAGFAEDNFWMHTVLIRVKKFGGPGGTAGGYINDAKLDNNYYIPKTSPPTEAFYKTSPGSGFPRPKKPDNSDDIDGWFTASKIGDSNNVNWYANINQNLELDPAGSSTVKVTVEVVAVDCAQTDTTHNTPNTIGPVETLDIEFSKDVPMITNKIIKKTGADDREYTEGIKASDLFLFSFDIEAIKDINTLTVRVNGASTPITLINGTNDQTVTGWEINEITPSAVGKKKRNLTVTVDSTAAVIPGLSAPSGASVAGYPFGSTGNLALEITAIDATDNKLSTTNTFIIGIDNFYPTAVINTLNIAADSPPNKYYFVEGTAQDYGTGANLVQGLDKVLVYFERANIVYENNVRKVKGNDVYVRPNGVDANPATDFITYPKILDHEGSATSATTSPNKNNYIRFPKLNSGVPLTSPSAMVIDSPENGATTDVDGDGVFGEIWNGTSANKEFGARVNFRTGNWVDGPYIVHYIILDQAGNAAHYQNDIYLENNKPRISTINFGTDINGDASVTSSPLNEYLYINDEVINPPSNSAVYGVMTLNNPYFRIRGERFAVKFTISGGNNGKGAVLTYVTKGTDIDASSMQKGRVYTIVNQGSGTTMTDFTRYGAPNNIVTTTFVATGPAAGTSGKVTPYTQVHRFPLPSVITNGTITVTNFAGINDSHKNSSGDVDQHNERFFILRVYDTTISNETSEEGWDQLADAILLKVDIDNQDSKAPLIEVLPFGYEYNVDPMAVPPLNNPANYAAKTWKLLSDSDYSKNIVETVNLTNGVKEKSGYVQYAYSAYPAINPTGVADISGKVKFLGKAEDNHSIASIWATIKNYNNNQAFQIAQTSSHQIIPVSSNGDWEFKVLDTNYQTLEFGHSFSWEFMFDSSKHPSVADDGITVTFEVRDAAYSAVPAGHSNNVSKTVNIVPYISEIVTSLSGTYYQPSVFNRSALGGYPVRQGETITIKGFNLSTDVKIGTIPLTSVSTITGAGIKGTIPTTDIDSGPLIVTVNGKESFNNSNRKQKEASYNKEPNGVNNNILDNSRYIYVWNTGYLYNTNMSQMANPFMRMDNKANRYMSYGNYGAASSGRLRVRKNNNDINIGDAFSNRMVYTTVGVGGRNSSFYAAGTDLSSSSGDNRGFQLGLSNNTSTNSIHGDGTVQGANGVNLGNILITKTNDSSPERYKIPRIAVLPASDTRGDNPAQDRLLISYYDDSQNPGIEVIYVTVGATVVATSPATTVPAASGATGYRSFDQSVKQRVTDGTAYKGSIYTAAGLLNNGYPVIAWYENATQKLIFSYNTAASSSGSWVTNAAIIADGKGTHVDMAVDAGNNVHLAYYSDDGGLWYTYIPSGDVLNSGRPKPPSVRVDTFLSPGTKLMINIRDGIPCISYAHASFPGTRHSIRVAWRLSGSANTADGTNGDDTFTGKWEVMTVPVRTDVIPNIDEFVCNGVPTSSTASFSNTGTGLTYNSPLNETILVGFLTNSSYEGAILRGNILTVPDILRK